MTDGIGYPKFYIYDSTGTTLQSIPENIGTAGVVSLSKNVSATNLEPERLAIFHEDLPYTHASLEEWLGYRYRASLTITKGSYHSTLLQYAADQANPSYANDIYKMRCVQAYADAGYKIKFTPHNDLEDLWGTIFPVWVNLRQTGRGRLQTIRSDVHQYEIIGSELLSTAEAFYAFSFTHLNGVTNANQCMSFNGTDETGSFTATNCGKAYAIEFWLKSSDTDLALIGNAAGNGILQINATSIYHAADGTSQAGKAAAVLDGAAHHVAISRDSSTTITFYKDGASLGTSTIDSNADWTPSLMFYRAGGTLYYSGKIRAFRCYQRAMTAAEALRQYNSGYGNWPLDTPANFIYEFDGTGGTGTSSETDQSGNGKTLTLANAPTRTTW